MSMSFYSLLLLFSHSVVSSSLWPHGLQHARPLLCLTISQSSLKLMSIELVMPSNHLVLSHPLLLLPSVFSGIGVPLYHLQCCYDLSNVMICLMGLLIQSSGYADSDYYFLIAYSLWVILLWLHCILCNNMNMPENSFMIHDDFLTHIGRYTSNMIKQDRKLISVNKQMNFQYGNVHMMKSKEGWRIFFN